jgi:hypothetical protein
MGPIGDIIGGITGLIIVKKGVDMIAGSGDSSDSQSTSSESQADEKEE